MIRVLSIDWDYFISATNGQRVQLFPDGGSDLPLVARTVIWAGKYANAQLHEIGIKEQEFKTTKTRIQALSGVPCMVVESHVHMYYFALSLLNSAHHNTCEIVNLDFHSDISFEKNIGLSCSNWLSELIKQDHVSKAIWVGQESIGSIPEDLARVLRHTTDIDDILDLDYTAIFLCRSDMWSPPHLDNYFHDLADTVLGSGTACTVDASTHVDRMHLIRGYSISTASSHSAASKPRSKSDIEHVPTHLAAST